MRGRVAVNAFGFDERVLLDALARSVGCHVTRDERGIFRLAPAEDRVATVSLTAENMSARELLAICVPDLAVPSDAAGQRAAMSLFVDTVDRLDVARAIAAIAGRTIEPRAEGDGYEWR